MIKLFNKSLIQHSISSWEFSVLFIKKKEENKFQMCIDYQLLNDQIIKNEYSLS